jgi:hypothetical protein
MDAGSESDMPVRPPCKFKPFGMLIGSKVIVGRTKRRQDLVALPQPNAAKARCLAERNAAWPLR